MCESNVYLRGEDGDELVIEDAVLLESGAGKVKVLHSL